MPIGFGMNFVDVVATDQNGVQNSTTCFVLAAGFYSSESQPMPGAVALRLDPYAIGDPDPSGSTASTTCSTPCSAAARCARSSTRALTSANPISSGGCGIFSCQPNVNYNAGSIAWDQPTTTLALIPGGLRATVKLPNVRLNGQRVRHHVLHRRLEHHRSPRDSITAQVDFSLSLQGGLCAPRSRASPTVTVGNVTLNGSGFCGFIINLVQSFFTGTVKNAVQSSLQKFITNNVGPLLDQLTSSLDIYDARAVVRGAAARRNGHGPARVRPDVLVARHRGGARADRHRHAVHAGHDDAEPAEPRHPAAHLGSAARSARHQPVASRSV